MIRASIDIGSNSTLLLAAELSEDGKKISRELLNLSFITSLGKDLDKNKVFHPESMEATFKALTFYRDELKKIGIKPEQVIATATEAARVAGNSSDFFSKIKDELGFKITVISSEGEAFYTAYGVASGGIEDENVVIMDIGGASTELIRVQQKPFKIVDSISLPIGSVRAKDWEKNNIFRQKIEEIFSINLDFYQTKELLCVAGGMTSIAAMYLGLNEFEENRVNGLTIKFSDFKKFANNIDGKSLQALLYQYSFLGKRAEVISSAAKVASKFGDTLKIETMKISTRGLRYGTILSGEIDEKFCV